MSRIPTVSRQEFDKFLVDIRPLIGAGTYFKRSAIKKMISLGAKNPRWLMKNPRFQDGSVKSTKGRRQNVYKVPTEADWQYLVDDGLTKEDKGDAATSRKPRRVVKARRMPKIAITPITPMAPFVPAAVPTASAVMQDAGVHVQAPISLVPDKAAGYVPFGRFKDIATIIASGKFYPIYITGLSGNGKTMMVEQAAASVGRECIRVNVTAETDEDDLIGGFRLVNGNTVWHDGPVLVAMKRGAVLLLDEVDLASIKIMCLQPVLEGHPIFVKKINAMVRPAPGFTIMATANTKGRGSLDGKFIGTNVMNEAFLERFSVTIEQEYPPIKTEKAILDGVFAKNGLENPDMVDTLAKWAEGVRKTYYDNGIDEIITTRRLVHIVEAMVIFNDELTAVELCLNRFDAGTKTSLFDLYKMLRPVSNENAALMDAPAAPLAPAGDPIDATLSTRAAWLKHQASHGVVNTNVA